MAPLGCKHSGDIRAIPDKVGTAEYIEINLPELKGADARYVLFTCNAYSGGELTPNLVVGWMNSLYPMKISATSGVAYDPSCVQQQVRISNGLQKGLVFGVLDVQAAVITWLEMDFQGQVAQQLHLTGIETLLRKLRSRISVGQLLTLKASAQQMTQLPIDQADEVYDAACAKDAAKLSALLL
ncbi:MAG TPA: hypothetical protein PLQ32_04360 [Flavihumibacter sp.]|nr:hypothetical protein [Bacteroidota bacterium]HPZ87312.1 hypothetical protein [Flavihumibacter sp.]HQD08139.1 hypothetical protein [Flavihumibacter sp.]